MKELISKDTLDMLSLLSCAQAQALGENPQNFKTHNNQLSGIVLNNKEDEFIALSINDKKYKLKPSRELDYILYRGQNKFYNQNFPTVYRKNLQVEDKIINELKKLEFIELLKEYPILRDLSKYEILNCSMEHDFQGLSQHYGFFTSHLDLTSSKDIAMFFATTKYENGRYSIINKTQYGVLYTLNYIKHANRINVIGAQSLPRSGSQKGFSINLNKGEDFNEIADKIEKIKITRELSEYYFHKFDGGEKLMPKDLITKKANIILDSNSIYINSIKDFLFINKKYTKKDILNIIREKKYSMRTKRILFSKKERNKISKKWFKEDKEKFFSKVSVRGCIYT